MAQFTDQQIREYIDQNLNNPDLPAQIAAAVAAGQVTLTDIARVSGGTVPWRQVAQFAGIQPTLTGQEEEQIRQYVIANRDNPAATRAAMEQVGVTAADVKRALEPIRAQAMSTGYDEANQWQGGDIGQGAGVDPIELLNKLYYDGITVDPQNTDEVGRWLKARNSQSAAHTQQLLAELWGGADKVPKDEEYHRFVDATWQKIGDQDRADNRRMNTIGKLMVGGISGVIAAPYLAGAIGSTTSAGATYGAGGGALTAAEIAAGNAVTAGGAGAIGATAADLSGAAGVELAATGAEMTAAEAVAAQQAAAAAAAAKAAGVETLGTKAAEAEAAKAAAAKAAAKIAAGGAAAITTLPDADHPYGTTNGVSNAGPNDEDPYGGDTEKAAEDLRTAYATGDDSIISSVIDKISKAFKLGKDVITSLAGNLGLTGGQFITGAALLAAIAADAKTVKQNIVTTTPDQKITDASGNLIDLARTYAPTIMNFSDNEVYAGNLAASSVGATQPYLDRSAALTEAGAAPITQAQIESYMNPYLDLVAGRVTEAGKIQENAATRRAAMAGADLPGTTPGMGNQADIASGIVGRNTLDALGVVYAGGFDRALGAAERGAGRQLTGGTNFANLATTAQEATNAQISNLTETGSLARDAAISGLNAGGNVIDTARQGMPSTVTTTLPAPSTTAQLVAAAAALNAFGNRPRYDPNTGNLIPN